MGLLLKIESRCVCDEQRQCFLLNWHFPNILKNAIVHVIAALHEHLNNSLINCLLIIFIVFFFFSLDSNSSVK